MSKRDPRAARGTVSESLLLRLDAVLWGYLQGAAKAKGVTVSAYVREAVAQEILRDKGRQMGIVP